MTDFNTILSFNMESVKKLFNGCFQGTASALCRTLKGQQVGVNQNDLIIDGAGPFVPLTKKTVCYIVSAVILKDIKDSNTKKVLLVQEAKKSCRGLW